MRQETHSPVIQVSETSPDGFRAVRYRSPDVGLSVSVTLTMRAPAFAQLRFGMWSRILVGQVNRGDYVVLLHDGRAVGFGGWMPALKVDAEAWLNDDTDIPVTPRERADCALANAMLAPSPRATRVLAAAMWAEVESYAKGVYAKRAFPDGRRRLVRLPYKRPPKDLSGNPAQGA